MNTKMSPNTIHETVVRDVIDTIKDGINTSKSAVSKGYNGSISTASSLSKATSGLTLVFPVLVDGTIPIETAGMLAKAVESRAVTMLQIAFSAFSVTNSKDAYDFIKNFHTNLGSGKITMDDVLSAMDSVVESSNTSYEVKSKVAAVLEDFRHNCNFYLEEDTSDYSINDYKVIPGYASDFSIVKEDITPDEINSMYDSQRRMTRAANRRMNNQLAMNDLLGYNSDELNRNNVANARNMRDIDNDRLNALFRVQQATDLKTQNATVNRLNSDKFDYQKEKDKEDSNYKRDRDELYDQRYEKEDKYKRSRDKTRDSQWAADYDQKERRNQVQNAKDRTEMLSKMVLPGDIKKANEMMPTMMVVNFCTTDENLNVAIQRQIVIGVKAKLIPVNPSDVANKIIVKHADGNVLLKFIRSTTREISFFKDFLFAIDNAKLNAVASSKKGSLTYRYMRLLERRALKGKIRKTLRMENTAKAMSTLVVSSELVEQIKIENHIDLERADVIRPIMEKLNLMIFIIADETGENIKLIMDTGDDSYETISYTHLERDTSNRELKKSINLMTKMNR